MADVAAEAHVSVKTVSRAQQMFLRLLGDESPAQTVVMPTRLIVRASGSRLRPGADRRVPAGTDVRG